MAFVTIIGGLGTIEGPIIGTIVYLVLQQTLASYNAWYLIILGLVAILVALFARRGLWGLVDEHLNVRLFPVGYWLRLAGEGRRGAAGSSPSRPSPGGRGVAPPALAAGRRRAPRRLSPDCPAQAGSSAEPGEQLNRKSPPRASVAGGSGGTGGVAPPGIS